MTRNDKVLITLILTISIILYLIFNVSNVETLLNAEILVDGNTFTVIELNDPDNYHLIDVTGPIGTSVVEVNTGKIRMVSSPCPDHICMDMGWISKPGQVIACVPNRIIIKVVSNKNTVDSITH